MAAQYNSIHRSILYNEGRSSYIHHSEAADFGKRAGYVTTQTVPVEAPSPNAKHIEKQQLQTVITLNQEEKP
jgi:hypothetical protein